MFSPAEIYQRIEERRRELGLSQTDVGLRAFGKVDNTAIQSLKKGSSPSVERLKAIADVLGLELYFGDPRPNVPPPGPQPHPPTYALPGPTAPALAEPDAAPFVRDAASPERAIARILGATRPGIDLWRVNSGAMALGGMLVGDLFLLDTHQHDACQAGDIVIAQIYSDHGASTVLRRLEPPVLVAASTTPADARVHLLGPQVQIRGKVIASWRTG